MTNTTLKHESHQLPYGSTLTAISLRGTTLAFLIGEPTRVENFDTKAEATAKAKEIGFSARYVCKAWLNSFTWGWIIRGEHDEVYCQDGQMRHAEEREVQPTPAPPTYADQVRASVIERARASYDQDAKPSIEERENAPLVGGGNKLGRTLEGMQI